jgi:hypothetical protein
VATVATICVFDQETTMPALLPSHITDDPYAAPKDEPEIVICAPTVPLSGDTLVMETPKPRAGVWPHWTASRPWQ